MSRPHWDPPRPLCAFAFLSWLLRDSSSYVRVPGSLGTSPPIAILLKCPGFSGTALVFFIVPLLWVPPFLLCAFVFLSWLLRESSRFVRVLVLWVPPHPLCAFAYLSWHLLDSPCFFIVPPSLGSSISLVCFHISVLTFLGQLYFCWCPRFSEYIPIPCVLLLFCPGLSGTTLVFLGPGLLWVPSPPTCVLLLFCPAFSVTTFVFLGSRLLP